MTFEYTITQEMSIDVVALSGELIDRNQANELITRFEELLRGGQVKFVFDLENLKYMNSSGLNVLINMLTQARKSGGEVVIANVSKKVNELLIITKLNTVFTVVDSVEKAIARLK